MEAVATIQSTPPVFNSALETGIRALVLLEALHPRKCDLREMTWFDYLVVHTSDSNNLNAPPSLHPDLPSSVGELLVRRSLVEAGLRMMQSLHLVDVIDSEAGTHFCAGEDAPSFLDLLEAPYTSDLKIRAKWLAETIANLSKDDLEQVVTSRLGRWAAEFAPIDSPIGIIGDSP